jgi:hypothetical protein
MNGKTTPEHGIVDGVRGLDERNDLVVYLLQSGHLTALSAG